MIDEGVDKFKGRGLEILPAEGVVWCDAPKSATQSWTEVEGGWSTMVLKEFTSDYWSQLMPCQDVQPGEAIGAAYWYSGCCCCLGMNPGGV
jgi:hypothetical protein